MSIEDMNNEIRAAVKLCTVGQSGNTIEVIRCGQLPRYPYFFIDMELCDFNLETYILQFANGVAFIHRNNEVHRDLKPRNGVCLPNFG